MVLGSRGNSVVLLFVLCFVGYIMSDLLDIITLFPRRNNTNWMVHILWVLGIPNGGNNGEGVGGGSFLDVARPMQIPRIKLPLSK